MTELSSISKDSKPHSMASWTNLSEREWLQIFNTALLQTKLEFNRPFGPTDITALIQSPAIQALIVGISYFADTKSITPLEAARELIRSFRKLDQLWTEQLLQEGIQKLRSRG